MSKKALIEEIQTRQPWSKDHSAEMIDVVTDAIARVTSRGIPVHLRGFGSFQAQKRAARIARNPRTGEAVPIPAKVKLTFKDKRG